MLLLWIGRELNAIGVEQPEPNGHRLFIEYSKKTLTFFLLFNGNVFGEHSVCHTVHLKENCYHRNTQTFYSIYIEWWKKVTFLLGQQGAHPKYPCYLCVWGMKGRETQWEQEFWKGGKMLTERKIIHLPHVQGQKMIYHSLHIQLGPKK